MPQMRSFGGFLPQNLAQSYATGVGLAQKDEDLAAKIMLEREQQANAANIAAANRGLARDEMGAKMQMQAQALAQEKQQAMMQDALRREALQQETVAKAQELEVEKAYREGIIGLKGREVEQENQKIMSVVKQAEDAMLARKEMGEFFKTNTETGEVDPNVAARNAMGMYGARADLSAGSARAFGGQASGSGMGPAQLEAVGGDPEGRYRSFQTGEGSRVLVDTRKGDAYAPELSGIPGTPGLVQWGKTARTAPEMSDKRALQTRLQKMEDNLTGSAFAMHRESIAKSSDPSRKLTAGDISRIAEYRKQEQAIKNTEAQIAKLQQIMDERAASAATNRAGSVRSPATLPPGVGGGSTTNKIGRFKVY